MAKNWNALPLKTVHTPSIDIFILKSPSIQQLSFLLFVFLFFLFFFLHDGGGGVRASSMHARTLGGKFGLFPERNFLIIFSVEFTSHAPIPLFRKGSVQSGSVN